MTLIILLILFCCANAQNTTKLDTSKLSSNSLTHNMFKIQEECKKEFNEKAEDIEDKLSDLEERTDQRAELVNGSLTKQANVYSTLNDSIHDMISSVTQLIEEIDDYKKEVMAAKNRTEAKIKYLLQKLNKDCKDWQSEPSDLGLNVLTERVLHLISGYSFGLTILQIENNYYFFSNTDKNTSVHYRTLWHDAMEHCGSQGMSLAVMETRKEMTIIGDLAKRQRIPEYWVAASNINKEGGNFYWTNNQKVDDSWWQENQPDDADKSVCVVLDNRGMLQDLSCYNTRFFVCKVLPKYKECID